MRRRAATVLLVLLAVGAAACDSPAYTRSTVERDLQQEVHLTAAQSRCLTEQLEVQVPPDQLSSHSDPSDVEREQFRGIVQYAIVACSGTPYNAAVVAQGLAQHAGLTPVAADCIARHVGELVGNGNVTSAAFETALLDATASCASGSAAYSRPAARAALASVGYANYAPCLATLFQPRAVRRSLPVLTAGYGRCLAPKAKPSVASATSTTAPATTTTG